MAVGGRGERKVSGKDGDREEWRRLSPEGRQLARHAYRQMRRHRSVAESRVRVGWFVLGLGMGGVR